MKTRLRTGPALARLATSTADISRYAPLRYQPVHETAEGWVVARPDDVAAALSSAALTVGPAGEPSGAAARLQAQMARFTDGAAHQRRRALIQELLPDAACLERDAWSMTSAGVAGRRGRWDAMELARRVPCAVLAASLGVAPQAPGSAPQAAGSTPQAPGSTPQAAGSTPQAACAVADLTGKLCAVLAPRSEAGLASGNALAKGNALASDGDAAATALLAELAAPGRLPGAGVANGASEANGSAGVTGGPEAGGSRGEERAVAAVSILFQARDATAGLIGLALCAAASHPQATAAGLVRLAERGDPPVQCTRRVAARPVTIGGVTIPAGALVWVLLATADRGDPWPPATFGGGPHACPARLAATALAGGVVGAILGGGWRPVPGQPVSYEPRPNLRIPVSVLLERS
jgi:cytochrome P450